MIAYLVFMKGWRDQPFRNFLWVGEGEYSPETEERTYNGGIQWKRFEGVCKLIEETRIYPLIAQRTFRKDYTENSNFIQVVEIADEFLLTHPDPLIRNWALEKWKRENPT